MFGLNIKLLYKTIYLFFIFFFFNDTATTEIYTLSLHDALPIFVNKLKGYLQSINLDIDDYRVIGDEYRIRYLIDRKSTRLNSSHANISYAVFCLKKKKKKQQNFIDYKTRMIY